MAFIASLALMLAGCKYGVQSENVEAVDSLEEDTVLVEDTATADTCLVDTICIE